MQVSRVAPFLSILFAIPSTRPSLLEVISKEPEFSSFKTLLYRYDPSNLINGSLTVFVPTNSAFERYTGVLDKKILLNHVANEALPLGNLDSRSRIVTQKRHPALWVTRGRDYIYVNNALVDVNRSDYAVVSGGSVQLLHVIDEVLAPVLVTPADRPARAIDLIQSRLHQLSHFFAAVVEAGARPLYSGDDRNTYFLPVNAASGLRRRVNGTAIGGHVVPHHALFTRPSARGFPFPTVYQSSVNVVLSFVEDGGRLLVESRMFSGGSVSKVTAEVLEADIPLENGVAHVVNTTLVVLDGTPNVFPYLTIDYKLAGDPSLSFSYDLARSAGFFDHLKEDFQFTFFVPRDEAWNLTAGGKKVLEHCSTIFFRRHVVVENSAYSMKELELLTTNSEVALNTLGGIVWVKVVKKESGYYVVWGEKVVKVYRADYACANGYVHVLDGPLLNKCDLIRCRKAYADRLRNW